MWNLQKKEWSGGREEAMKVEGDSDPGLLLEPRCLVRLSQGWSSKRVIQGPTIQGWPQAMLPVGEIIERRVFVGDLSMGFPSGAVGKESAC